ncbi:PREDICTED: uncharacterized protein LOC105953899 [Erythranthe guttata]|uniref:uncharacterized protein LOC105953899 n=1 Tax=Erythranthe guttata TaxID=4155 RepID=UPI00064D77DC|nr:PREDICTED: uncharacterized protein LOC105953899 [Erythranthe guttata]|eukprot:XP_012833035.1 PREDICTED: uncharacterized protein LOC105953899 [Erythranthe guttata]
MSVTPVANDVATMEMREASPAHFLIKIESFSLLQKCGIDKYETKEFDVGEYKWRLIIYPNGDYISVYLATADKGALRVSKEVNVVFSIFLFNQISNIYLSSLGYLVNDNCVFGAEVCVLNTTHAAIECLSLKNVDIPYKHEWVIYNNVFSVIYMWSSEEFEAGGYKWKVTLYPKGNGEATGRSVSIYLHYVGSETVKACYTIWIKNPVSNEHVQRTDTQWFSASVNNSGWLSFIEFASFNDPTKGFTANKRCLLDIEISVEAVAQ